MTADVCFTDAFLFWFSVYAFTPLLFCHTRCPQGMMGSRALSHDSIFLADEVLTDAEPARVLSQENVQSKIKALQVQTFTLGVLLRIEPFWTQSLLKTLVLWCHRRSSSCRRCIWGRLLWFCQSDERRIRKASLTTTVIPTAPLRSLEGMSRRRKPSARWVYHPALPPHGQ